MSYCNHGVNFETHSCAWCSTPVEFKIIPNRSVAIPVERKTHEQLSKLSIKELRDYRDELTKTISILKDNKRYAEKMV